MSNQAFLNLFDIQKVSSSLEKGNLLKAQTALLDHYNTRVAQDWPLPPDTITDLRLNISELSQKQLIAQADSIVEFRIASDGSKPIITEDGKIEWCANPISSPEWLWRLNRHQWWPVLGLAYKQSGDERYANIFVGQLLDWIKKNPPPLKKDEKSPTWRLMEVGMRMRVSWIPAFGLFYESPKFTRDAKLAMLRSIYDHAKFLSRFKTNRNHLIRESNGLAYISIYFFEFKEAQY
jgi:heparan-sulfate lyase